MADEKIWVYSFESSKCSLFKKFRKISKAIFNDISPGIQEGFTPDPEKMERIIYYNLGEEVAREFAEIHIDRKFLIKVYTERFLEKMESGKFSKHEKSMNTKRKNKKFFSVFAQRYRTIRIFYLHQRIVVEILRTRPYDNQLFFRC